MDDRVFDLYVKATSTLNDKEKKVFQLGFSLGTSQGIADCTKKLKDMDKK